MKNGKIANAVLWLCRHLEEENLLTAEECEQVIEAIEGFGFPVDLESFLNVVRDNQLCTDMSRISALAAQSHGEAKSLGTPPPRTQRPPSTVPKTEEPSASPTHAANVQDWCADWPNLQEAEGATPAVVKEILARFLAYAREHHCSDVHLAAGAVPFVRRYKRLHLLEEQQPLTAELAEALNTAFLTDAQKEQFHKELELDFSYELREGERYRVNLMKQRLGLGGSYRLIDSKLPEIRELGFPRPDVIEKLAAYGQGLILVTGPAGSGKSTTMNALVHHINRTRHDHIITLEDPIEVVHQPLQCNVTQRELHRDTRSFANALRAALREDPDVIVIGELRDLETIEMAIHASETGHLVIGTLHTSNAADTMSRILDVFPAGQQGQIRSMVAESLKGVICQQLVPNKDETGCCLATEILLGTLAVSNLIREGKTFQLPSALQTGRNVGMCTMEQSFLDLYMEGKRSFDQTRVVVKNQEMLRLMAQTEAGRAKR